MSFDSIVCAHVKFIMHEKVLKSWLLFDPTYLVFLLVAILICDDDESYGNECVFESYIKLLPNHLTGGKILMKKKNRNKKIGISTIFITQTNAYAYLFVMGILNACYSLI